MLYLIFGSSGGLGSNLVKFFKKDKKNVKGLDISASAYTDYLIDFNDTKKLISLVKEICLPYEMAICCIYCAIPNNRIRGGDILENYIIKENNLITLQFNSLLAIACALESIQDMNAEKNSKIFKSNLISIGSVLSNKVSLVESPLYPASKAASLSLIKYLSLKLSKKQINCNTISPGLMARNEKSKKFLEDRLSRFKKNIGITNYEEIYQTIIYISNSNLNSLRGKNIVLDDGLGDLEPFYIIDNVD
tara:strand:+ start:1894 stop:2637 length:744 start_codon:yes stop_codon:yes gene_type:complete